MPQMQATGNTAPTHGFGTFINPFTINDVVSTALLVEILLGLRLWLKKSVERREDIPAVLKRQTQANIRIAFILLLIAGVALIWAPQLRTLALSLTAILVAIVLATKELILCLTGTVLKRSSDTFSIGSWVRIGDYYGEVIDQGLMTTRLQEISQDDYHYTGRTVTLPNSIFLTTPVSNLHIWRQFAYHSFSVFVEKGAGLKAARTRLLNTAEKAVEPFRPEAEKLARSVKRRADIELREIAPKVRIKPVDEKKLELKVTIFCPNRETIRLEQEILEKFFTTRSKA